MEPLYLLHRHGGYSLADLWPLTRTERDWLIERLDKDLRAESRRMRGSGVG